MCIGIHCTVAEFTKSLGLKEKGNINGFNIWKSYFFA